ncbi:MAG: DNA gyrase inhibitor YacG [Burkholderiales bacterium]|jgi:endogenous inhibitor of DNA gyrase (YacG/DUF329 family)|nr:DNA gyrase inhibitor YacG [Burkholderiales bacterium]
MKKTVSETIPATAQAATVACPQCGATVVWSSTSHWKPFCSERCKLLDLGAWANESYRVAGTETADTSEMENALATSLSGVQRPH